MKELRLARKALRKQLGWFAKFWVAACAVFSFLELLIGVVLLTGEKLSPVNILYCLAALGLVVGGIRMYKLRKSGVWMYVLALAAQVALIWFGHIDLSAYLRISSSATQLLIGGIVEIVITLIVYFVCLPCYNVYEEVRRDYIQEKKAPRGASAPAEHLPVRAPAPAEPLPVRAPEKKTASTQTGDPVQTAEAVFRVTYVGKTDRSESPVLTAYVGDLMRGSLHVGDRVTCSKPPYVRCRINALSDVGNRQTDVLLPGEDYVMLLETDGLQIPDGSLLVKGSR